MISNTGCADVTYEPDEEVYHTFLLSVDSSVKEVRNLRYHYGSFGWLEDPREKSGPVADNTASITVPDFFEISWDAENGQHYSFSIPVRSKIKAGALGKSNSVLFVIMSDHVEGYIETSTRKVNPKTGLKYYDRTRERFY